MLLFAAGESTLKTAIFCSPHHRTNRVPKYLRKPKPRKLCLMAKCREVIRGHLLRYSIVNLLVRVPQIGLPSLLTDYLLYNMSLDGDGDDGDNDYYDEGDDDNDDTPDDSDDDNDDTKSTQTRCQSSGSANDDDDDMDSDGRCRRAPRGRTFHSYGLSNFCYCTDSDSDEYDDSDDSYGPAPFKTYRR